jgi:hypothetical protein
MMKIDKRPIVPGRIRRVPREGWSWIDRRFLHHHASELSGEAITLYFFLAAVGDKHGVSFYGDDTTAALLRLDLRRVQRAREELESHDLVAHRHPLTQVLSLPQRRTTSSHRGPARLGDIMRSLAERTPAAASGPGGRT